MAKKADCILLTKKPKATLNITSTTCCQSYSKTPVICWEISSYFNKTELQLTRHGKHRNGLCRTVLTSSVRTNGHPTLQTLTPWTTTFGVPCFINISNSHSNPQHKEQLKHALQAIWDELPQNSI